MKMEMEADCLGFCPSFNCYFSDNNITSTSTAAAKVSREFMQEQAHEFSDNFEFFPSPVLHEERVLDKQVSVQGLLTKNDVVPEMDYDYSVHVQIRKLFVDESSSEDRPSGAFCMWRPKTYVVSSTLKKSRSTGSGATWWRILNLLRRSNREGKESILFLPSKKMKTSKQKQNVDAVQAPKEAGKLNAPSSPSFQELFYSQKRAEKESGKRKSLLPYQHGILGFYVINRSGNKRLPF